MGSLNMRRKLILKGLLDMKFRIAVYENNCFGEEYLTRIRECKTVLNIHYYNNAFLERSRLNDAFFAGKRNIISEEPGTENDREHIIQFYKNMGVVFVPYNAFTTSLHQTISYFASAMKMSAISEFEEQITMNESISRREWVNAFTAEMLTQSK